MKAPVTLTDYKPEEYASYTMSPKKLKRMSEPKKIKIPKK